MDSPDFDRDEGEAAEAWLQELIHTDRGRRGGGGFAAENVQTALGRMRECAPGIDGVSKRWVLPPLLIPLLAAIYSFIYAHGISNDAWELAIVASVKKNGPSLTDMTNQRGVHILQFFRQLVRVPVTA